MGRMGVMGPMDIAAYLLRPELLDLLGLELLLLEDDRELLEEDLLLLEELLDEPLE